MTFSLDLIWLVTLRRLRNKRNRPSRNLILKVSSAAEVMLSECKIRKDGSGWPLENLVVLEYEVEGMLTCIPIIEFYQ